MLRADGAEGNGAERNRAGLHRCLMHAPLTCRPSCRFASNGSARNHGRARDWEFEMNKRSIFGLVALLAIGLMSTASLVRAEEKEKEEGKEVKVKFDQVPAAVQKTLTEESKGAKIDEVDKEEDDGKVIYEADVTLNGKNYEIKV